MFSHCNWCKPHSESAKQTCGQPCRVVPWQAFFGSARLWSVCCLHPSLHLNCCLTIFIMDLLKHSVLEVFGDALLTLETLQAPLPLLPLMLLRSGLVANVKEQLRLSFLSQSTSFLALLPCLVQEVVRAFHEMSDPLDGQVSNLDIPLVGDLQALQVSRRELFPWPPCHES